MLEKDGSLLFLTLTAVQLTDSKRSRWEFACLESATRWQWAISIRIALPYFGADADSAGGWRPTYLLFFSFFFLAFACCARNPLARALLLLLPFLAVAKQTNAARIHCWCCDDRGRPPSLIRQQLRRVRLSLQLLIRVHLDSRNSFADQLVSWSLHHIDHNTLLNPGHQFIPFRKSCTTDYPFYLKYVMELVKI